MLIFLGGRITQVYTHAVYQKELCSFESHSSGFPLASITVVGCTWTMSFDFLESELPYL